MTNRSILIALVAFVPLGRGLEAQEIQVPVDAEGRVEVITADLARRLGLFAEVPALVEARLFRVSDSEFVLEITSNPGNQLRRERRSLSAQEVATFRADLTTRTAARAPTALLDRSGRVKLLVGSTALGIGYYGWATAAAFDPRDEQSAVAVYLLSAAGSFFVPLMVTSNAAVPDPVASMALWGATRGPIHGFLLADLGDARSESTKLGFSVALGWLETVAGGVWASSPRMGVGRPELTAAGGDIGLGSGFFVAGLLGLDERYRTETDPFGGAQYRVEDRTLEWTVTLAGVGLGLAGGYWLGGRRDWGRGDGAMVRNASAVGALVGLAVGDMIQQPRVVTSVDPYSGYAYSRVEGSSLFERTHHLAGLIGTAAGAVVGERMARGGGLTASQGTLLTLSSLAGGLFGLGIGYVVAPRDTNDHSELYLTSSALGAAAGLAIPYRLFRAASGTSNLANNFEAAVNPLAAAQLASGTRQPVPLASIQMRF